MAGMTLPENLASLRMELSECTTAATYATSLQVCCAGYLEWHSNMSDIASLPDTLGDPALIQSLNAYYMGSMFDRCVSNSDAKWRVKRPACCMVSISLAGSMSDAFVLGMCRSCLQ